METPSENVRTKERTHYVLLIHGIRTQAEYQQHVCNELEVDPEIKVIPLRYEFFDLLRFLLWFRERPVTRITTMIQDTLIMEPRPEKLSIVAHSFGTYIISQIIKKNSHIKFYRIIFCGGIVVDSYPWEQYSSRFETPVLNDCGLSDTLPVLAKFTTWGYGSSGRFGFGHNRTVDRFHEGGHSSFFTGDFPRKYWLPYLSDGEIVQGELNRPKNSWLLSISTILKLPIVLLLAGTITAFNIFPLTTNGYNQSVPIVEVEATSIPELPIESEVCDVDRSSLERRKELVETDLDALRPMIRDGDSSSSQLDLLKKKRTELIAELNTLNTQIDFGCQLIED